MEIGSLDVAEERRMKFVVHEYVLNKYERGERGDESMPVERLKGKNLKRAGLCGPSN
jgi:hypothetical protein